MVWEGLSRGQACRCAVPPKHRDGVHGDVGRRQPKIELKLRFHKPSAEGKGGFSRGACHAEIVRHVGQPQLCDNGRVDGHIDFFHKRFIAVGHGHFDREISRGLRCKEEHISQRGQHACQGLGACEPLCLQRVLDGSWAKSRRGNGHGHHVVVAHLIHRNKQRQRLA